MRDSLLIVGVVLLLGGIAAVGVIGSYRSKDATPEATYQTTDTERPQIEITENQFDLGHLRVDETRTRDVVVKNVGTKPLIVKNFATSCDCTFATMSIGDNASPRFTMHNSPRWSGAIEPGQTGMLTIIYEPARMPVQGSVERAVLFETNDPGNPRVQVVFTATVD